MGSKIFKYLNLHSYPLLFVLGSLVFYSVFAYGLDRTDFPKLLGLFAALFFFQWKLIQFEKWNLRFLLGAGLLFRLVFLLAVPNLSQDFYRFLWDGQLIINGINPYLHLPKELLHQPAFNIPHAEQLYNGMGTLSARNFSNYPPLNQIFFALTAALGGHTILGGLAATRALLIFADLGTLYFGRKLLKRFNLAPNTFFWYFLNPLVIIELTGNVHYEGVLLFFFVWAVHLLACGRWQWAGVAMGASISVKLVPLLFLPVFLKYLGFKKSVGFYSLAAVTCVLLFLPFYTPEFVQNYTRTLGLWFSNFEFNASMYNVVKAIGVDCFGAKPWELIKSYGQITPYLTVAVLLLFSFVPRNDTLPRVLRSILWVLAFYFFLAAVVHPWYVLFPLVLCLYTPYRFPLVWSGMVVLSYFAYSQLDFKENLGLLALEYGVVFSFIVYEMATLRHKT